jgi:hypothetical protein
MFELKVPFRQVYCDSVGSWLKAVLWCHVVIKVFPFVIDLESLPQHYLTGDKSTFLEQFDFMFKRVLASRG